MLKSKYILSFIILVSLTLRAQQSKAALLEQTILKMDSTYFAAYNNCDMETQAKLYSDSIEFYHDKGGLVTDKEDLLESIKANICGKVTRELVENSIEVHEIPGFGAIEIGMHKFHNNLEPDTISQPSQFIAIWQETKSSWKMTRVISLH